ncbi:hypothetical protein ACTA71_001996 [Dictyostelium dimigraforme]
MISHINIIYSVWVLLFVFTSLICFFLVNRHLIYYSSPNVQRNLIRIIILLPLNSGLCIITSFFPTIGIFANIVRNCYMAFILNCFFSMMTHSIGEKNMIQTFESHPQMKCLCCKTIKPNRKLFNTLRFGTMQFFIIKIMCSIVTIAFISVNEETHSILNVASFAPYEAFISIISFLFCFISLCLFLAIGKEKLNQFWPKTKLRILLITLVIELLEFIIFSVIFIKGPFFLGFKDSLKQAMFLYHFTTVVLMFLFSIVYLFLYSFKNYKDKATNEPLVGEKWKDSFGLINYLDVLNPVDFFVDFGSLFKRNNNKFKELVELDEEKKPNENIEQQNQEKDNDEPLSVQMA